MFSDLYDKLKTVPDYRGTKGRLYDVTNLRFVIILAFMAGEQDGVSIADYAELHFDELHELIGLRDVPSHDTISRCLRFTDWVYLSDVLDKWVKDNFSQVYNEYCGKKAMHVDGKAIRAQTDRAGGGDTLVYMNSITDGDTIDIKCQAIDAKSNEITTLPGFIDTLNIFDCIVTIDAIGTQIEIIRKIIDKKGHYLLPVKDNQKNLRQCFISQVAALVAEKKFDKLETTTLERKGHGRIEHYECHLIKDTTFLLDEITDMDNPFLSIGTIAVIDKTTSVRKNDEWQKGEPQRLFYISDLTDIDPLTLLELKLAHWQIESEHWRLDVIMREDSKTARKGNAAINMTGLRRLVMKAHANSEDGKKRTLKAFMRRCALSIPYTLEALLSYA